MPRSLDELMAYADDLADQFEAYTPSADDQGKESQLMALRRAVYRQSLAQRELVTAVQAARDSGASWAKIGRELGTSGEAARQRYGGLVS